MTEFSRLCSKYLEQNFQQPIKLTLDFERHSLPIKIETDDPVYDEIKKALSKLLINRIQNDLSS